MMDVKASLLMNFALIVANCQSTISRRNDDSYYEQQLLDDMKFEMESMRQLLIDIKRAVVRSEAQAMQQLKSEIDTIRQIVLKQHDNETQAMQEMKSEIDKIRETDLKQHGSETQALQEMKSEIDKIRQIVIQQQYWSRNEQRKTACPLGFDYLPEAGRCFTFVSEEMTWAIATARCRRIMPGVHLAAITSQEEQDAIVRYLQLQFRKNGIGSPPYTNPYLNGVWISGQRRIPGQCDNPFVWKTLDGISIPFKFTRWMSGEPNCDRNLDGEPCVHIVPGIDHNWNDARCSTLHFTLCEMLSRILTTTATERLVPGGYHPSLDFVREIRYHTL